MIRRGIWAWWGLLVERYRRKAPAPLRPRAAIDPRGLLYRVAKLEVTADSADTRDSILDDLRAFTSLGCAQDALQYLSLDELRVLRSNIDNLLHNYQGAPS